VNVMRLNIRNYSHLKSIGSIFEKNLERYHRRQRSVDFLSQPTFDRCRPPPRAADGCGDSTDMANERSPGIDDCLGTKPHPICRQKKRRQHLESLGGFF
jgi:hypothetical protein